MQTIFNKITSEITQRNALRQQIHREFNLIRRDKLSSEIDLFACFYATTGEPRGSIGRLVDRHRGDFYRHLLHHQFTNDVEVHYLPATLGTTLSRDNFTREKEEYDARQEADKEALRLEIEEAGMDFIDHEIEPFPDRMMLLHVDDFFTILEQDVKLERILNTSAYIGDGKNSLIIVQALRQVPDYSSHFPLRPPRNGNRKKDEAPDRAVPLGHLNPV